MTPSELNISKYWDIYALVDNKIETLHGKKMQYWCVMPMNIQVACSLYKFIHGTNYLHYIEMFVAGRSIIHI